MIFGKPGRTEHGNTGAHKMQGPESFDKLPEYFPGKAQFIATALRPFEEYRIFGGMILSKFSIIKPVL